MEVRRREQAEAFTTLDGSTIRVLIDGRAGGAAEQSLAEATVAAGASTQRHHHARTEEIYIVVAGSGRMEVEGEEREIGPGDAVLIPRERGTGFGPGRQASCGSSAAALRRTRTRTPLSELLAAVYRGDESRVEEILAADPPLDVFEAAAVGRIERLEELLDTDPGLVSAWTEDGFTPLHLAAFFRQPEAARLLVERGALVDVVARNDELQVTPLQSAVAARQQETAALLLERGADPTPSSEAVSPRCTSRRSTATRPLARLLARGADRSLAADDGRTAADFAREGGHAGVRGTCSRLPRPRRRLRASPSGATRATTRCRR